MNDSRSHTYLLFEAVIVFIGTPLLFYWEWIPIPKLAALIIIAGYCAYILWKDYAFTLSNITSEKTASTGKRILIQGVIVCVLIIILIRLIQPEQLLAFPSDRPLRWGTVMLIYPLLSAFPQELIYRSYFFHRYRKLVPGRYARVVISALAFAFLHLVYDNGWAVVLSFLAGILFGITYLRTRSLFWVSVEHVLYGWMVFTLGLGNFFYEAM